MYAIISDLHFGNKGNLKRHNENLLEFFKFLVNNCKDRELNKLIISGDTFEQRDKLSVETINYAIKGIEYLSENFKEVYIIVGNHDMFFKDRIDVNSVNIFKHLQNVMVVDTPMVIDDTMLCPWVISGEDYDNVVNLAKETNVKKIVGHFEFSTFMMNDHYLMEHGLTHKALSFVDIIVSGHYHKRQAKDNVVYVGTPFPYDMNDANDTERGFMVLKDDSSYEFVDYQKIKVISVDYKEFINNPIKKGDDTTIRVVINEHIDVALMDTIKELLLEGGFDDHRIEYKFDANKTLDEEEVNVDTDFNVSDMDSFIISLIMSMETDAYDKSLLVELFKQSKPKV